MRFVKWTYFTWIFAKIKFQFHLFNSHENWADNSRYLAVDWEYVGSYLFSAAIRWGGRKCNSDGEIWKLKFEISRLKGMTRINVVLCELFQLGRSLL